MIAKRAFDLIASSAALIILSPVWIVISLAILIGSRGPVFYRASRIGQHGRPFKMYKFRTMVVNADKVGPGITLAQDKRITPQGRFLRKTKLDELPQLINVVRGEMSIVGPRPEDPRYVAMYTPEQRAVLNVRPGLTSPASIHYSDESSLMSGADWETQYVQVIMPDKIRLDLQYAQHPGLVRDLGLIFQTIRKLWAD